MDTPDRLRNRGFRYNACQRCGHHPENHLWIPAPDHGPNPPRAKYPCRHDNWRKGATCNCPNFVGEPVIYVGPP